MTTTQNRSTTEPARSSIRYQAPSGALMCACTIVARNYLAQARVLVRSFKHHHPDCSVVILVVDELASSERSTEDASLLNLNDIGLENGEAQRMAMIYNVTELSTAVKPWLLRHLLNSNSCPVVYFDPDIEIFAPLYDIAELAQKHSIVLTPHVTEPIPRDKLSLTESDILGSGIYNLGFIAVGPGSEPFLDWWSARLRRECVVDPARMRFTDQRWIDFVPGLYPHYILRDPTCNVAYWNLYSRRVVWTGAAYEVNGRPLRFFHFSGYDPDKAYLLSKHQGDQPRILLSQHPGVARICKEYADKLRAEGFNQTKRNRYGFDSLKSGVRIDWYVHSLYREALARFEEGTGPEPPNPLLPDQEVDFVRWLNEPMRRKTPVITRYMYAVHGGRPDLQAAFPDPLGKDATAYYQWFMRYGAAEVQAHESLMPTRTPLSATDAKPQPEPAPIAIPAVNVVGYLRAELGVGEAARLLISGLEASGTPYNAITNRETLSRQSHPLAEATVSATESDINILCVNADQIPTFAKKIGPSFFANRYTIGVWFWEVEDVPAHLYDALNYVDEVWVASEFIYSAFAKISPKPIFKFHLPITMPLFDESASRYDVGLSERFTFLFSFDFLSVLERKNPAGLIEAFRRAFPQPGGPALVIKTINGDKRIHHLEKLRFAAADHPDIVIRDGYISAIEKNTMTALCDCYVSLHRSEGFGLTMAEAMCLGKPVIATGYSGNMEFMTRENSYLCSYTYRPIGSEAPPYPPTSRWAEPNLDDAAFFMRQVYENQAEARERGRRAAEEIRKLHSPAVAGKAIRARLDTIRGERAKGANKDAPAAGPPRLPDEKTDHLALTRLLSKRVSSLAVAATGQKQ